MQVAPRLPETPLGLTTLDIILPEPIPFPVTGETGMVVRLIRERFGLPFSQAKRQPRVVGCTARRYQKGIGISLLLDLGLGESRMTDELYTLDIVDQRLVPRILNVLPFLYADSDPILQALLPHLTAHPKWPAILPEEYCLREPKSA